MHVSYRNTITVRMRGTVGGNPKKVRLENGISISRKKNFFFFREIGI